MFYKLFPCLLLAGCFADNSDDNQASPVKVSQCQQVNKQQNKGLCQHQINDIAEWENSSLAFGGGEQVRGFKYLVARDNSSRLNTMFINANYYTKHYDFMVGVFYELFPTLSTTAYLDLIFSKSEREYFAGGITEYSTEDGPVYGFSVWDQASNPAAALDYAEALTVYETLKLNFKLSPLSFVPNGEAQKESAGLWNAAFPVYGLNSELDYETYTSSLGYGYLRIYDAEAFQEASHNAEFGYQDILVLEEAPEAIERVIGGAVTGSRQAMLGHLNVLSANRNTPNCYINNASTELANWQGKLVKFECENSRYTIVEVTQEQAEQHWQTLRPDAIQLPAANTSEMALLSLEQIKIATVSERKNSLLTFGAKATNLAKLYTIVPSELQSKGFAISFAYYQEYMRANSWLVDLGDGAQMHSFADTVSFWLNDTSFNNDAKLRREYLKSLQKAMKEATVPAASLQEIIARIEEVFGNDTTMVRFRSSSNAEDGLIFNGAGLYDSTSACVADETDGDSEVPSHCDSDKNKERTITRALNKVWASLWNISAYEEREWYGIEHAKVQMGILVNLRSKDELANIVAFTGNPNVDDERYLVNSQFGDFDVVASPGISPEVSRLTINNHQVSQIDHLSASSLAQSGEWVISDAKLNTIGEVLSKVQSEYPIDTDVPNGKTVLLDTEWKVLADGQLFIKQIRPFVR